jgi:hypothetical protein
MSRFVFFRYAMRLTVLAIATLALAAPLAAQGGSTHVLVISGLAGDPGYGARMQAWATQVIDAARERFAVPAGNVQWLAERTEIDSERVTGPLAGLRAVRRPMTWC